MIILSGSGTVTEGVIDPTTITGCSEWVSGDQSSLSTFSNDDPVQTWLDRVTGTRTWSQATLANRPLFKTGGPNGLPYLAFDATDSMQWSDSVATLLSNAGYVMFIVVRPRVGGNANKGSAAHLFADGGGQVGLPLKNDGSDRFGMFQRSGGSDGPFLGSTSAYTQNVWYVAEFWYDGTNINIKVNNDTTASTARGATALAFNPQISLNGFVGDVAERITYNVDIGSTDRGRVRTSLATKYAITIA